MFRGLAFSRNGTTGAQALERISNDTIKRVYGFGEIDQEDFERAAYTLMIIIGADGEVAPEELEAFLDLQRRNGAPPELLDALQSFDWHNAKLEEHLPKQLTDSWKRILLYDAVRLACADGVYDKKEREAARNTAALLGVSDDVLARIEDVIDAELTLQAKRIGIFACQDD